MNYWLDTVTGILAECRMSFLIGLQKWFLFYLIDTTIFTLEYISSQINNICFISGNSYYWVRARIYISHCVLSSSLGALPRSRPALWGPLVHGDENGVHEGVCRMHRALFHLCILGKRNCQHSWLVSFSYILHYHRKI